MPQTFHVLSKQLVYQGLLQQEDLPTQELLSEHAQYLHFHLLKFFVIYFL